MLFKIQMLVMIESNILLLKLTLFSTEEFFCTIYMFVKAMSTEIDALEITPGKGVKLQYSHPHLHGCMATKTKLSPMPGNYISIPASKFQVNSVISIK